MRYRVQGEVENVSGTTYEAIELEASVYRGTDMARVEVHRFVMDDLPAGGRRRFDARLPGEHARDPKAQAHVVLRRLRPERGIWDDPRPVRVTIA